MYNIIADNEDRDNDIKHIENMFLDKNVFFYVKSIYFFNETSNRNFYSRLKFTH